MNNLGDGQWITFQQEVEFLPRHVTFAVSAIQPVFPATSHLENKRAESPIISGDSEVGIMASHFRFELFPLLSNRLVHVLVTPLLNTLNTPRKP